jgi:hypothetical protein
MVIGVVSVFELGFVTLDTASVIYAAKSFKNTLVTVTTLL